MNFNLIRTPLVICLVCLGLQLAQLHSAQAQPTVVETYDCATFGTGCTNPIAAGGATVGDMDPSNIFVPQNLLNCAADGGVLDLDVDIQITHTWRSDLDVFLSYLGSGVVVELFTDADGSADDVDVLLDDEAAESVVSPAVCGSGGPCDGTVPGQPEGMLSDFDGVDYDGSWQLDITDDAGGDGGALVAWELRFLLNDRDGDLTSDCRDECPDDPNKTLEGSCGCGVPEVDSNLDGYSDCVVDPAVSIYECASFGVGCTNPIPAVGTSGLMDTSTITVPDTLPECTGGSIEAITDVGVQLEITHTWRSDLDVTLTHVNSGLTMELFTDIDGSGDDFDIFIDDDALEPIQASDCGNSSRPCDGTVQPEGPDMMSVFDGIDPSGAWNLDITDDAGGDEGDLVGWSIAFVLEDGDTDGTPDCADECPADPAKTVPGQCGCGVADTDTDGDGTADCLDICIDDPSKTQPGTCGCDVADTDTDGDGTADCNDACVNDANKTEEGSCGCGNPETDANSNGTADCVELGTTDVNGLCVPGGPDCAQQPLPPQACVGANGFLGQINILSVINLLTIDLSVLVEYFDLQGSLQGQVTSVIGPNLKQDFILNDLGLKLDEFGTACVTTNAQVDGAWTGGNTLYKEDTRVQPNGRVFGDGFDFAIYEPFVIPNMGKRTLPLNTFHLGTDPASTVANFISIIDAVRGDNKGLTGSLVYFDETGAEITQQAVNVPDGARRDFAGHEGLAGVENKDAVGLVEFRPDDNTAKYYLTVVRYFFDCPGASCTNFLTAFNIPFRPGTNGATTGGVSTADGEISIVELINTSDADSNVTVNAYQESGSSAGNSDVGVPARGTRSVVVNQVGSTGFLAQGATGAAEVTTSAGSVSAYSLFYRLDEAGKLLYAYSAPFVGSPGAGQISQFNSFISHGNSQEIYNSTDTTIAVDLTILNLDGSVLFNEKFNLGPRASRRFDTTALPVNTYGTVVVTGDKEGLVVRNYVERDGQYKMPFAGE